MQLSSCSPRQFTTDLSLRSHCSVALHAVVLNVFKPVLSIFLINVLTELCDLCFSRNPPANSPSFPSVFTGKQFNHTFIFIKYIVVFSILSSQHCHSFFNKLSSYTDVSCFVIHVLHFKSGITPRKLFFISSHVSHLFPFYSYTYKDWVNVF